eukprot:852116_1
MRIIIVLSIIAFCFIANTFAKSRHMTSSDASTMIYIIFVYVGQMMHNMYNIRCNKIVNYNEHDSYQEYGNEGEVKIDIETKGNDVFLGYANNSEVLKFFKNNKNKKNKRLLLSDYNDMEEEKKK